MQNKNAFLFSFPRCSLPSTEGQSTNKREQCKTKYEVFVFIVERKYLRPKVKGSANRAKCKIKTRFYFHFRGAAYLRPKVKVRISENNAKQNTKFLFSLSSASMSGNKEPPPVGGGRGRPEGAGGGLRGQGEAWRLLTAHRHRQQPTPSYEANRSCCPPRTEPASAAPAPSCH